MVDVSASSRTKSMASSWHLNNLYASHPSLICFIISCSCLNLRASSYCLTCLVSSGPKFFRGQAFIIHMKLLWILMCGTHFSRTQDIRTVNISTVKYIPLNFTFKCHLQHFRYECLKVTVSEHLPTVCSSTMQGNLLLNSSCKSSTRR